MPKVQKAASNSLGSRVYTRSWPLSSTDQSVIKFKGWKSSHVMYGSLLPCLFCLYMPTFFSFFCCFCCVLCRIERVLCSTWSDGFVNNKLVGIVPTPFSLSPTHLYVLSLDSLHFLFLWENRGSNSSWDWERKKEREVWICVRILKFQRVFHYHCCHFWMSFLVHGIFSSVGM